MVFYFEKQAIEFHRMKVFRLVLTVAYCGDDP